MVHYLEGRTIYGRVALSCGQTLWLDPAESKVLLKSNELISVALMILLLYPVFWPNYIGISVTTAVFRPLQELKKVCSNVHIIHLVHIF